MQTRILILAKSCKKNGFCVAGIDLATNKFVRLISKANTYDRTDDSLKGENLQYSNKQYVEVGDVVEFDICNTEPENHQTENIVINPLSMPKKHFLQLNNIKQLRSFFSSDDVIYGNTERFIGFEQVKGKIFNSIGLYKVNDLCIYQKSPDKYGANFKYNGKEYKDLPVTDPKYKKNANKTISNAVIMVTLTKPWFDQSNKEYRCYKIIATIFENLDVLPTIH